MLTMEADVRNEFFGRVWLPSDPRIRLMPGFETAKAIVDADALHETRGRYAMESIINASAGKRVVVILHGYNSAESKVRAAYAALWSKMESTKLLEIHYDVAVFLYWPGGTGPAYWLARMRSGSVGEKLRKILKAMSAARSVDVQGHSMGVRCALEAMKNGDTGVRNIIMAAAAVQDDDCVIGGKYAAAINALTGRALVPYSDADKVLAGVPFRVAELDKALGATGPQPGKEVPEKMVCVDASGWGGGHSVFRAADGYYKLWQEFLEGHV